MYGYQKDGVRFLKQPQHPALQTPYGSGKTWVVLKVAHDATKPPTSIHHTKHHQPLTLILCKRRNVITWQKEIVKYGMASRKAIGVIHPDYLPSSISVPKYLRQLYFNALSCQNQTNAVTLLPYSVLRSKDTVSTIIEIFKQPAIVGALLGDESTTIKNPKAQVTKAALRLSRHFCFAKRIALTGNLTPEGPQELWSQFAFGGNYRLGRTYYQFLRKWFIQDQFNRWVIKHELSERFFDIATNCTFMLTDEQYHELLSKFPTPHYVIETYDPSRSQVRLVDKLYDEWALPDADNIDTYYKYTLQVMNKAQQICSGFYYDQETGEPIIVQKTPVPKVKLLQAIVKDLFSENHKRKVVIWRAFRFEDPITQQALHKLIPTYVGPSDESLNAFEKEKRGCAIVMPLGCSTGFNELAQADVNIFFSNKYSLETRQQAEARICRLNNLSPSVTQIDLASSYMRDADVIGALQTKSLTPQWLVSWSRTYLKERNKG